jgi:hypothetical protein
MNKYFKVSNSVSKYPIIDQTTKKKVKKKYFRANIHDKFFLIDKQVFDVSKMYIRLLNNPIIKLSISKKK